MTEDRAAVAAERARLDAMHVGPLWSTVVVAPPDSFIIFGIDRTPSTVELIEQCEVEHDVTTQWAAVRSDHGLEAFLTVEFTSPVQSEFTLRFTREDVGTLDIIAAARGAMAFAFTKEDYKVGRLIGVEAEYDVPKTLVAMGESVWG